ncbi:c-type cytochrome [Sphingomonas sp. ac-8]|uniref:c-type cytochrome n=1 Tax=Sphingomonas sp. ac-8 TaxID=3242977 RepID=UPI003A7F8BD3
MTGRIGLLLIATAATMVLAGTQLSAQQSAPAAGAQVFATCRACHTLGKGQRSGLGPNLNGLFGRQAASLPGYNYSPALKKSGIRWDDKSLDTFLAAPTKQVPGTRMVVRVDDPKKRAALIAYLKAETAK